MQKLKHIWIIYFAFNKLSHYIALKICVMKQTTKFVDKDEVELKNFCHSLKKFFLRYVLSVKSTHKLFTWVNVMWLRKSETLFFYLQFVCLVGALILTCYLHDFYHWNDARFYYLKKLIGVGCGWVLWCGVVFDSVNINELSERIMHRTKYSNMYQYFMYRYHSSGLPLIQPSHS